MSIQESYGKLGEEDDFDLVFWQSRSPEGFDSYEEAATFWETHDTTDYLNEFRTVELKGAHLFVRYYKK